VATKAGRRYILYPLAENRFLSSLPPGGVEQQSFFLCQTVVIRGGRQLRKLREARVPIEPVMEKKGGGSLY